MSSSSNAMHVLSNLRDPYWETISANMGPHKVLWSGIETSYLGLIVSFFLIVSSIFNDSEHRANCILSSSLPGKVSQSHVLPSYNMNMMFNQKYTQYQSFSRKITMRIVQVAYPIVSVRVSTKPAIAKLRRDRTLRANMPHLHRRGGVLSHGHFSFPLSNACTSSSVDQ